MGRRKTKARARQSSITPESYPGFLYDLAISGHRLAADALVREWGGQTIDVPAYAAVREGCRLASVVGKEAAEIITHNHGPGRLYVPLAVGRGAKKRAILAHPGGTRATAKDLGTSEQWVRRVRQFDRAALRTQAAGAPSKRHRQEADDA